MTDFDYDLFVIGGGSGGVRGARIASQHGARVAIAEEYRYGGTCVIRGCVPKKLLVYASRFSDDFEDAAGFGWQVGETAFDWPTLIANKDRELARLEGAYQRNLDAAGVTTFHSRAEIIGPNTIRLVSQDRQVSAKHILVATGGHPNLDTSIDGIEHVITSNEAFHLDTLPASIVIVGGGYIAVEFAGIFAGLGVETTLLYRGPKILRGFDEDLRDAVTNGYKARGINIVCDDTLTTIANHDGRKIARLKSGGVLETDTIMFAIGRSPYVDGLGLENAGVETDTNGAIVVDTGSKTSAAHIYAVGDVTDRVALTPVAIREGHAVADTLFGNKPWTVDHETIATAVFSTPELGTVGLTEDEAANSYDRVEVYAADFRPMKATLSGSHERMFMKLLVDADSDRVLGLHMAGADAGEIAQMAGILLKIGATKADFDTTVAVHPSAAEELVTMRTASRTVGRAV